MNAHVPIAIAVACLSLSTAGGGAWLVQKAHGMPAPVEPEREVTGTVIEIAATMCGNGSRRGTCYRPVVEYIDGGKPMQVASRTGYRPASPHQKGDSVPVFIEKNGTAWLASEWNARHAKERSEYDSSRGFPLVMGWLLIGCRAFGLLLAAGLTFWIDRIEDPPPQGTITSINPSEPNLTKPGS